jgi:transcriptional regulator with XRE-family HTH domain
MATKIYRRPSRPVPMPKSHTTIPTFDILKAKVRIEATGRSVADIARSMGLERQTVGHWLRGRGEPNMKQMHQMARELGCHWLELVNENATVVNDPAEKARVEAIRAAGPEMQAMIDRLLGVPPPPKK